MSSSPRFDAEKKKGHLRSKTNNGYEIIKPVYEL
jgi:hypothetical protein